MSLCQRNGYFLLTLSVVIASVAPVKILASDQKTRLTTDDLVRFEEIGGGATTISPGTAISPDGNWIVYVLKRPKAAAKQKGNYLVGYGRADLWLVSVAGGEPVNITKGDLDGSGYWNPIWSPDSKRLAMLSTRGGNFHLWVWERESGRLRQITGRGVRDVYPNGLDVFPSPVVWLSDQVIACVLLPEGQKSLLMTRQTQAAEVASREWTKAWAGSETTASVLDSGRPSGYEKRSKSELIFADVIKGTSRVVAYGDFTGLSLSPDKRYLATLELVDVITGVPWTQFQLAVFSVDGTRLEVEKKKASPIIGSIRWALSWAPSGTKLAILGQTTGYSKVYLYEIGEKPRDVVTGGELVLSGISNPRAVIWSAKDELVVRAEARGASTEAKSVRADWWITTAPGRARNLTASFNSNPAQLVSESRTDSFVGSVEGKLWRIFADGSTPIEITGSSDPKITSVVWPTAGAASSNRYTQIVVGSKNELDTILYDVDLASGRMKVLAKPNPQAEMVSYDPERRQATFTADTREGSYIWLSSPGSLSRTILETNTFLRGIGEGQKMKIDYRGLEGQELKAWLILPPDYQPGKRYPMVTWVYAGTIAGEKPDAIANLNQGSPLNLQLLAAEGYIVLLPSMPLRPYGEASDPFMELSKGVLPAVDRVIELGYADPARLGVMGQSYGGYSTYGLITQTNRFKAAVSLAGPSDLISLYGIFDARERYEQYPHGNFLRLAQYEIGQFRMGNPPWKDMGRYVRNSPIFYVDRVETPLMIVQGDLDYVAIQQGEEFFTALYRQNKRARFVRYWGEGHVLDSPANIRDMWHRIFAWFDEFLDISRDDKGNLIFDGDNKVKSRNGAPPLTVADFARFNEIELKNHPWVKN